MESERSFEDTNPASHDFCSVCEKGHVSSSATPNGILQSSSGKENRVNQSIGLHPVSVCVNFSRWCHTEKSLKVSTNHASFKPHLIFLRFPQHLKKQSCLMVSGWALVSLKWSVFFQPDSIEKKFSPVFYLPFTMLFPKSRIRIFVILASNVPQKS